MGRAQTIEDELAGLSQAQEKAPDPGARKQILEQIEELHKRLRRTKQLGPFQYSHQGSLAYIGNDRAVADISWLSGNFASGGTMTYLFWRSAYISMVFSSESALHCMSTWRHLLTQSSAK